MKDRGMKKYLPYKSLVEQEDFLKNVQREKRKIEKPILMEDEEEKINRVLTHIKKGDHIIVKYFENGEINLIEGKIIMLDVINRKIILKGVTLLIDNILGITKS